MNTASNDPWQKPDSQSDDVLNAMMTRLEDRGDNHRFRQMILDYLEHIPSDKPIRILDLGCGTGVVTREIRNHVHKESEVTGADVSARMLEKAAQLAPDMSIKWAQVPEDRLPFHGGCFDIIVMHTLMTHVPDPLSMLSSARTLLKPDGTLIIFDADYAGNTFAHPDLHTMRETDFKLFRAIASNIDICRQLPALLKQAGYALKSHRGYVLSEAGHGDFWLSSVRGFAKMIPSLGVLTPDEGHAWVNHMLNAHENGTFFASGNYYTFVAQAATQ